jgi:hypothetical protein
MPDFVGVQSAPVAPPSGGDPVETAPAQPTSNHHEGPAAPTTVIPDSRPVEQGAPQIASPEPEAAAAIPNGDFDHSTIGWEGDNAALTLVTGVDGNGVRVSRVTTEESFSFHARKALRSQKAGSPYKVRAFVRSVSPGMFVCLRAEEHTSGPTITTERCAPTRAKWQRLKLRGRTAAKGTKVTFSVHVNTALGGKSFDVDGFRLAD